MPRPLRQLVKRAVRVVLPAPTNTVIDGDESEHGGRVEPSSILGHVPGIDCVEYGLSITGAEAFAEHSTIVVGADAQRRACRIFFLCGHPRSGTHWMDAVLNRHPRVRMEGEYRFEALRNAFDDLTGRTHHAAYREPLKSEAERCFADSVRRIIGASGLRKQSADWLGDRTPRPLRVFLPGSPHFLILRDPRDVIVSWAHQELKNMSPAFRAAGFESELAGSRAAFMGDPEHFIKHPHELLANERWLTHLAVRWRRHLRTDLEALRAIQSGEIPARVRVIRYETIHTRPEEERQAMYRFLGLDPAQAVDLDEKSKSAPGLAKENPHAIYRKGEVGDWVNYFTPQARAVFKRHAGPMLLALGYAKDDRW